MGKNKPLIKSLKIPEKIQAFLQGCLLSITKFYIQSDPGLLLQNLLCVNIS